MTATRTMAIAGEGRGEAPLAAYSLFAAMLAMAGLPIYIHAPIVYAQEFGIGLASLGAVLFGLRLFDLVQDPALGWVVARADPARLSRMVAAAILIMAAAMIGLFAVVPPVAPLLWFGLTLAFLFTAYSFLTIAFYARGVARAGSLGPEGHIRLGGWREGGALLGVSLAAMAPSALALASDAPYALFAFGFAVVCVAAFLAMQREWGLVDRGRPVGFAVVLRDPPARRLLLLALVNAAPLSVTSTLFLFFVQSRLAAPGWEGPLLILFFLSAAVATPFWTRAAGRFGARPVLLVAMVLAILSFGAAATLGPGDIAAFALICAVSGAMLGADLVILPAVFARRMATVAPEAGEGFGLWSFATKFTLAFAAVTLLPVLEGSGFVPGGENAEPALRTLSVLYALVPCALKLVAVALLLAAPLPED